MLLPCLAFYVSARIQAQVLCQLSHVLTLSFAKISSALVTPMERVMWYEEGRLKRGSVGRVAWDQDDHGKLVSTLPC